MLRKVLSGLAVASVLAVVGWLPAVAAIAFVIGIATAGPQLALFDQFRRRIPKEHGVTFSSVDQSLQNFALVITPNIGGFLALALGVRGALLVVAAVGFAAFALFVLEARAARATEVAVRATADSRLDRSPAAD